MTEATGARAASLGMSFGVQILRDAWSCAREVNQDLWQLAVEILDLRQAGLSKNDLRWLISRGLAQHGDELTRPSDRRRRFRQVRSFALSDRACFVLTEAGYCFATAADTTLRSTTQSVPRPASGKPAMPRIQDKISADANVRLRGPRWDAMLHELRIGSQIVKCFKCPAPAQERILTVFEEVGWPAAIDDPLPAQFNQNPKRRLHYTVRNLNRGQITRRIRFFINGNGETIRWELLPLRRAASAQRARRRR